MILGHLVCETRQYTIAGFKPARVEKLFATLSEPTRPLSDAELAQYRKWVDELEQLGDLDWPTVISSQ